MESDTYQHFQLIRKSSADLYQDLNAARKYPKSNDIFSRPQCHGVPPGSTPPNGRRRIADTKEASSRDHDT